MTLFLYKLKGRLEKVVVNFAFFLYMYILVKVYLGVFLYYRVYRQTVFKILEKFLFQDIECEKRTVRNLCPIN